MRLLFATTFGHLPDVVGGLQTTLHELALALRRQGVEVALLCAGSDPLTAAPQRDRAFGYDVWRAPNPTAILWAIANEFQPDAIVVQTGPQLVRLLVAALDTGRPAAVYLHNVEQAEIGGVLLSHPGICYLANSDFTAARWRALFGIDCAVVTPCIDRDAYVVETTRERVLFVNPTAIKGVELMFQLAQARPQLPFTVVESWTLDVHWRAYCHARATPLGNIDWIASTADMRAVYGRARVLLMPSMWEETFGRSVTEAQLSGIPVLASDRGNLVDTVGPGGITVDAHAPLDRWIAALDRLWADADGRFAAAARAHAWRPEFDPARLAERFAALIADHVAAQPRA
jgi:glycosyltransferase involved in cell wall biosynthesis